MKLLLKNIFTSLIALLTIFSLTNNASAAGVYQDFDALPVTGENEIPGDGGGWRYSSWKTYTKHHFFQSCGFWNDAERYPQNNNIMDYFKLYRNGYNNSHMGFLTYQFLEIDNQNAINGNSLKITVTGGCKPSTPGGTDGDESHGLELSTKEEYLEYMNNNQNPVDSSETVGDSRIYMMNDSYNNQNYPIPAANNANMMSYYVYQPSLLNNDNGNGYPEITGSTDPFNNIGGHFYQFYYVNGGGWIHVIADTHPQHNNSWSSADRYPYPSSSMRAYDSSYFTNMYAVYISMGTYHGTAYPKYYYWLDEIEFFNDPYYSSMNHETINSPAIMLHSNTKTFEASWNGKYKNLGYCDATYEVRYSFSQISNDNWENAIPVHVQEYNQFNITANTQGIVKKPNSYRQPVWLSFKLRPEDENKLVPGTSIYFAIKDVSQDPNNLQVPNPAYNHGREYANQMSSFDFAGDAQVLPLIKRIGYYIPGSDGGPPPQQTKPVIQSITIN
jgi:hypothetical protein